MRQRKIIIALFIAICLPFGSYFIVVTMSKKAIVLPRKYFFDTVITYIDKGKQKEDTLWHSVADFKLVNQLQDTVSWQNAQGKIIVVDFMFTRCGSFCPTLTHNMRILQHAFHRKKNLLQLISLSVDPEYDNAEVLKNYADRFGVNHEVWWFLTGDKKQIYDLAYREFHVATEQNGEVDFVHTDKFVLLDKKRRIRGYYEGQDSLQMKKLGEDIVFLSLEKEYVNHR